MRFLGLMFLIITLYGCKEKKQGYPSAKQLIHASRFENLLNDSNLTDSTSVMVNTSREGIKVKAYLQEDNLTAYMTKRDTMIYKEPCFEIFIDPGSDGIDYYEIEVNAIGTIWDLKLRSAKGIINAPSNIIHWNIPDDYINVTYQGTVNDTTDIDSHWTCEVFIPWEELGGKPFVNTSWSFNFMRIDYVNDMPQYWVWKKTGHEMIHYPDAWPRITF